MLRGKKSLIIILLVIALICVLLYVNKENILNYEKNTMGYIKAVVVSAEIEQSTEQGSRRLQNIQARITSGPNKGEIVAVCNSRLASNESETDVIVSPGERIYIRESDNVDGYKYSFVDYNRLINLVVLIGIFILAFLYFGRFTALKSLFAISLVLIIFWYVFLAYGIKPSYNFYTMVLAFCAIVSILVPVITCGKSLKALVAVLGAWASLAFASILSYLAIKYFVLTGIESQEALLIKTNVLQHLDFRGVMFAGILVGSLGAILTATKHIASIQLEAYNNNPEITWKEMYLQGINGGKELVGSLSMTLILAYVSCSVPLLLMLVSLNDVSLGVIVNMRMVVSEIIRALVGCIGILAALPLTAIIMPIIYHLVKPLRIK